MRILGKKIINLMTLYLMIPIILFSILFIQGYADGRSVHRPIESWLPTIEVRWTNTPQTFVMRNPHLDLYPYFQLFNKDYFNEHILPLDEKISYRYDATKSVDTKYLYDYIEALLKEIHQKKKNYTHFDIVQNTDFNRRKGCGLIVLKFKDYPFILKLFIETPKSFINPQCKGFEPIFLFYLGGGINRHLSGFTRIKNREYIREKLQADPYWSQHADLPRKWFWISPSCKWFEITGHNIGGQQYAHTHIPATYGIIADAIESERHLSYTNAKDRASALSLCSAVDLYADPNISNFLVERGTHKLVIIDTEHFPSIVGFKEKVKISNYFDYFFQLVSKCAKDMLFSTKKELLESYKHTSTLLLT